MTKKQNKFSIKMLPITVSAIIGKAVEAVVAYIVLFFFKPLWDSLVKWWKKDKNEPDNKID
jgi:hypothetical protein